MHTFQLNEKKKYEEQRKKWKKKKKNSIKVNDLYAEKFSKFLTGLQQWNKETLQLTELEYLHFVISQKTTQHYPHTT
jgi:hypothetical protein